MSSTTNSIPTPPVSGAVRVAAAEAYRVATARTRAACARVRGDYGVALGENAARATVVGWRSHLIEADRAALVAYDAAVAELTAEWHAATDTLLGLLLCEERETSGNG